MDGIVNMNVITNESGTFWFDKSGILVDCKLICEKDESGKGKCIVKKLIIPEGVTVIGQEGFRYITVLEELSLPKSLKLIGSDSGCAFANSVLPDVVIGDDLNLGHYSFGSATVKSLCIKNGFIGPRAFKDARIKKLYVRMNGDEKLSYYIDSRFIEEVEYIK